MKSKNITNIDIIKKVFIYDSTCIMCDSFVQNILKKDLSKTLHVSALNSDFSINKIVSLNIQSSKTESAILILDENVFTESDAIIKVFEFTGTNKAIIYCLRMIPKSFRNLVYRIVARNRYRVMGKKQTCNIPLYSDKYIL